MSEQILKALMQLFAIIARPESNPLDRRLVVKSFLKRQLNQDLVNTYLEVFDDFYNRNMDKHKSGIRKTEGVNAVKIIRICTDINNQLTLKQKIIVLSQLFEFAKSENNEISGLELEFIITVAEVFNIPDEEHIRLKEFVVNSFNHMLNSDKILIIDNNSEFKHDRVKHLLKNGIDGEIRVMFVISAGIYLFRYTGSGEMYLNGQIIQNDKVYIFNTGSAIRNQHISPIYYSDIVSCFHVDKIKTPIEFNVKNVTFRFKNGAVGLNNINFKEQSGHLVAIMGASGAGKTTLLNTLNGTTPPTTGEITINGVNIYTERKKIEGLIGFVSQDDLLIEELTVFQNLYFNAKLCFDNYSAKQLEEIVHLTLQNLGLFEIKDIQVGSPLNKKISGGQRKRLNIALELLREPAILFLDEPTSGLSSRDSENIMDLLKELSLKGKLVFVVIHQPSSDIFKMFDNLLILDTGGFLIYFGKPIDSIMYFKERIHHANWVESECQRCGNVNPEQIFNIVESHVLDEFGKPTRDRKITPLEWKYFFKEYLRETGQSKDPKSPPNKSLPEISFKIPNKFKQFRIFAKRDILSKLSNTQYLFINILEAPILGFILSYLIKFFDISSSTETGYSLINNSNLPVYIFMSVIVAIFIGLSVSAEEIIKDRKILKRESFLNLSWSGYLLSKVYNLTIISGIQAFSFVIIGNSILEIKEMYWQYWLVLFSAWVCSNIMGLIISDSFKTVVTIYILIPFLVIPQIILSGVIVKYDKLNPSISTPNNIPWYGEIITARWGYEALAVYQAIENTFDKELYQLNKIKSIADFKKNYWVPNLRNKVNYIEQNLEKENQRELNQEKLMVLRNEFERELTYNKHLTFNYTDSLYLDKVSPDILESARTYINNVQKFYIDIYNQADKQQDHMKQSQQNTMGRDAYLELQREYHNEKLTEFVKNNTEPTRIIEYKGRLYQKADPVFLDPDPVFLKSHFYAPRKFIFGKYYHTFWVNIAVIWSITILLYIILYFRLIKRLLDYFEKLMMRFTKE